MSTENIDNKSNNMACIDGNEAAALIAYQLSEICAIYPITPSSTMAELADEWASHKRPNLWGDIPTVVEMQHEGGAAGAIHGALQAGALSTTFTASQGLMLMLPNMYKIAGELTPAVFHVAARSLAAQGLSIFGDHQDVMAARMTGFALLASSSVQEAHDLALIAHLASLESRLPFLHFFDGFRTSHEVNKIHLLSQVQIRNLVDDQWVLDHHSRALNPDAPVMRGTAQNPDVYFQARESVNPYYLAIPGIVQHAMDKLADTCGRQYHLVDYFGAAGATSVIVVMGSAVSTVRQTVEWLNARGGYFGVLAVRLYRPFPVEALLEILPDSVRKVAVLDRTKEPGSSGEPLYQDVINTLVQGLGSGKLAALPQVCGGRYGLSSKEFTPAMVRAVFDNLDSDAPKGVFTVGIHDDVTQLSLRVDEGFSIEQDDVTRALFFGLGSDGTVGANKNTIKIIGSEEGRFAQAYFVYDSRKSGAQTVSHLRFGPQPIDMPYLVQSANFIACHQWDFFEKIDVLGLAADGATLLINSPCDPAKVWKRLPAHVQDVILARHIKVYAVNANRVAKETGMGKRINTIMQTCFFKLSGVMETELAIGHIKQAIEKTYSKKGAGVVQKNHTAVDLALSYLEQVVPGRVHTIGGIKVELIPKHAPQFIQDVTGEMLAGRGDALPVSSLPVDGTYPTATSKWEKRSIARRIPEWLDENCIQCGNCIFVCPHAAIRAKFCNTEDLLDAPQGMQSAAMSARGFPETRYLLQVYADDCTDCGLCIDACPVRTQTPEGHTERALRWVNKQDVLQQQRENLAWFEQLEWNDRSRVDFSNVRGIQFLQPLFEFSGACAGCGETPYLKTISQLFGDRMMVANATGCSSIYGGNLPTTPWAKNAEGRGPAWSNSLFEDNAEFGFGFRLSADHHKRRAKMLLQALRDELGAKLVDDLCHAKQASESQISEQRQRIIILKRKLADIDNNDARRLMVMADHLVRRSIWIVGGDGWAYDIGSSGVDHVLASGLDVNILVMDTEVYSNTGGQMSKSTPVGAVAKFAAGGKTMAKKDMAQQAIAYGNVYVARVALGANPQQTLHALREAEAYPGPSLIIAYSHCIAHGINMEEGLQQQKRAVDCGHWPLIRYNPVIRESGGIPFTLDSLRPTLPLAEYRKHEGRFRVLEQENPKEAGRLLKIAEKSVQQRWAVYEDMATHHATDFHPDARRE